ncbi:hypothetical protein J6TS1_37990 [Siminovitchia terrae]|uniref:Uncharacterized protein n=1 Tax=Siminovitchia terrae TaxID=1914933 RepID=A0ABQ4L234_SIMTE|nr:hypothetical protein [Siminovitchia terrae]GIN89777.1 hypothetical protein J22TS1_08280 [Siminovitchia terrae]GIN97929.1 hypothetical protein J6TS1_37990 [Siminovitchia terrae]
MVFHSAGFKPRLNKVKASGGFHRFLLEIYRAELDKIWAQIRQGAFDRNVDNDMFIIADISFKQYQMYDPI